MEFPLRSFSNSSRPRTPRGAVTCSHKRITWCSITLALTFAVFASLADAADPVDDLGNCPIKTEEPASIEYSCEYNGTTYYFCCQTCVLDFKSDPDRFVVPARREDLVEDKTDAISEYPPLPSTDFGRLVWVVNRPPVLIHACAAIVLLILWLNRARLNKTTWWCILGLGLVDVAVLVGILAIRDFEVATRQSTTVAVETVDELPTARQLMTLEKSIHYTTLQNFGRPVRPVRHEAKPLSLSATYYRGNDERSSDLLNEGNYRTVTIQIKLLHDGGEPVDYDEAINAESLALRIVIDRAAGTSSGYFKEEYMQRMYLTQSSDLTMGSTAPVPDRVALVMTIPGQQWEGTFPIGTASNSAHDHLGGVVYLCEERYSVPGNELLGGRFHYAIEYDLYLQDGHVRLPSDLWMGATYTGEQYDVMDVSPDEWLTLDPLPELPASGQ